MSTPQIRFRSTSMRRAFPCGVATARQLESTGVSQRTTYRRCLEGGPWQRLLPGIVALSTGRPTDDQLVRAALLLGGPDAVITGLEACRRYGLRRGPVKDGRRDHLIHVLVPAARQVRSVGFVHVERTSRVIEPIVRDGVPLAPVAQACTDAARRLGSAGEITELLSDAVQRGLCTVAELATSLDLGSRRGTAMPRLVLRELAAGIRSAAEREARKLWAATGLPEPMWNVRVYDTRGRLVGIADCWLDDVAMAWEIESTEWHLSPKDHDRTVLRAADFVAAGVVYTASKPKRLRTDRRMIIDQLRATYAHAAARRRPAVRAVPEPP